MKIEGVFQIQRSGRAPHTVIACHPPIAPHLSMLLRHVPTGVVWSINAIDDFHHPTTEEHAGLFVRIEEGQAMPAEGEEVELIDARVLLAERDALSAALAEALDEFEDALLQVDPYYQRKWAYPATVARLRALLPSMPSVHPTEKHVKP